MQDSEFNVSDKVSKYIKVEDGYVIEQDGKVVLFIPNLLVEQVAHIKLYMGSFIVFRWVWFFYSWFIKLF